MRWDIRTTKLGDSATRGLKRTEGSNRILVNGFQLRVILDFALEVHLSEHVESRLFTLSSGIAALGLNGTRKLPA